MPSTSKTIRLEDESQEQLSVRVLNLRLANDRLTRELATASDDALECAARVCDAQETESFMVLSTARAGAAAMKAACVKAIRSLKAKPAPIASGDAVDAERYRWLREQSHPWGKIWYSLHVLDQHIDAAIRKGAE